MRRAGALAALAACCALALGAGTAHAAVHCQAPGSGEDWREVDPAAAGMDEQGIRDAIALGGENGSLAIRVYRFGCRVGEDDGAEANRSTTYESWSLAKSVTALVFGRAMTLGLAGPDDPLGSLVTEADQAHGAITLRNLLTMTSGLRWNGLRDYNILMPNRLQEALTVPVEKQPGTYWEYSQSGPALLAEAVQRAVGEDFQAFAQRELFGPLGIAAESWFWRRDSAGHTQGFFGLNMSADDFGRLGELMRRGGVWRGQRLLSRRFVREAVEPVPENGCYGWLIWLNALEALRRAANHRPAGHRRARLSVAAGGRVSVRRTLRPVGDGVSEPGHRRRAHRRRHGDVRRRHRLAGGDVPPDPRLDHRRPQRLSEARARRRQRQ